MDLYQTIMTHQFHFQIGSPDSVELHLHIKASSIEEAVEEANRRISRMPKMHLDSGMILMMKRTVSTSDVVDVKRIVR